MSPIIPLLILVAGAIALLQGLLPRFRYTGVIGVTSAGVALLALLATTLNLPARAVLSAWQPVDLVGVGLVLEVDALAWLYGLGVLVATTAALLTGLVRPGGRRVLTRQAMLLLTVAGLISIFADNLLTRIVAWALLDLIYFLALIFLAEGEGLEPQAVLNLAFNATGTLLAVAAAVLIARTSPALALRDVALSPQSTLLITLAALFRLGLFPLHLGLPTELNIRAGLDVLLRLVPAAVALETLSRLAVYGIAEPLRPWLAIFGLAGVLVGAAQLWNVAEPRHGLPYLVVAQSGVALLAGLWSGEHAALAMTAATLSLLLGGSLVYLSGGHDEQRPWVAAFRLVGVATLVGAPLTVGFLGAGRLYAALIVAGGWGWAVLAGAAVGMALLTAGLLYTVFWPGALVAGEPLAVAAFYSGLTLPAALAVVLALFGSVVVSVLELPAIGPLGFGARGSVAAAGLVLLTLAVGVALWRFEAPVRARLGAAGEWLLGSAGRLHWLYRMVWGLIRGTGSVIGHLAGVLEGEGAILWALVAGLLAWLALRP